MKKLKTQIFFKSLVLFFLSAYLLGSFANVLFIPSYVPICVQPSFVSPTGFSARSNYIDFHTKNILRVFDRSTIESNAFNEFSFIPKSIELIFAGFAIPDVKTISVPPQINLFYNHRHSYLSFCTFRI